MNEPKSDVLKLAFLGCGAIARFHLDGIQKQVPRIRVTAAIDRDRYSAERIAVETGARTFNSLEEGLSLGDFDAVDIMLPHDLHESAAVAAFAAGKHVLLEKPMATTLDACERILAVARRAGTVFMVAEHAQYWPEIVEAKNLIESGTIGRIITARASADIEFDMYWFAGDKPWRNDRARTGGGVAMDGGSHYVRPLRMWLGEIDELIAAVDHPLAGMEGESLVRALLRFASGKTASFEIMMVDTMLSRQPYWRITGTRGEIVIYRHEGLWLYDPDHREGQLVREPSLPIAAFGLELADFARAVLDRAPPAAGADYSLGEVRTALAIYRSVTSGQWEKVWS